MGVSGVCPEPTLAFVERECTRQNQVRQARTEGPVIWHINPILSFRWRPQNTLPG